MAWGCCFAQANLHINDLSVYELLFSDLAAFFSVHGNMFIQFYAASVDLLLQPRTVSNHKKSSMVIDGMPTKCRVILRTGRQLAAVVQWR